MRKASIWTVTVVTALAASVGAIKMIPEHQSSRAARTVTNDHITVNIGYQNSLDPLLLAQEKGWMKQAFSSVGASVNWVEFQNGPPMFQGIAGNHIDFGDTGNTPVITGQVAGVAFKEIAVTQSGLKGGAQILVSKNSSIHTVAQLKGKKVAVTKGAQAYNFLYRAIAKSGLKPSDVQIINMTPSDAMAAFNSGAVDAWSIADPNATIEIDEHGKRALATSAQYGLLSPNFEIVRTAFAAQHPDLVALYLKVLNQTSQWEHQHFTQAVTFYATAKHLPKPVVSSVLKRTLPTVQPVSKTIIAAQQQTASFLFNTGSLTTKVNVSEVVDNSFVNRILK